MSEERFDRLDQRLDRLEAAVTRGFEQVTRRFEQVDQRFERVDQRFEQVDQRFEQVDQRFEQVDQRFDALGREMRLLHEDAIARIAATTEYRGLTRADLDQSLDDLWERIGRELDPLKAVARLHTAEINKIRRDRR